MADQKHSWTVFVSPVLVVRIRAEEMIQVGQALAFSSGADTVAEFSQFIGWALDPEDEKGERATVTPLQVVRNDPPQQPPGGDAAG